jgi:hypothetical protein
VEKAIPAIGKTVVFSFTAFLVALAYFGNPGQSANAINLLAGIAPVAVLADFVQIRTWYALILKSIVLILVMSGLMVIAFGSPAEAARMTQTLAILAPISVLSWITRSYAASAQQKDTGDSPTTPPNDTSKAGQ